MDLKSNGQSLPFQQNLVNSNNGSAAPQSPVPLLYYPQYAGMTTEQQRSQLLAMRRANQPISPSLAAPVNIMMPNSLNPAALMSLGAKPDKNGKEVPLKLDSALEAETKRQKRLELNRRSAQLSRQRKKERLYELERTVTKLTNENQELIRANEALKEIIKQHETGSKQSDSKEGAGLQPSDAIQNVLSSLLEENKTLKRKLESVNGIQSDASESSEKEVKPSSSQDISVSQHHQKNAKKQKKI
eukprot:CAMPEP_0184072550 /NCGR_PEP_ID=MMETSP0957-20130417/59668_1 /TAXON_ID=627963 /ORGANISM="Aplanochytrium sp, Strain PBS07" /LENGTH=243 /DNA_ID=CAMNT_0026373665 /DNA_START=100 /DNA_END=831 /DNA_ORIENTATION=+